MYLQWRHLLGELTKTDQLVDWRQTILHILDLVGNHDYIWYVISFSDAFVFISS